MRKEVNAHCTNEVYLYKYEVHAHLQYILHMQKINFLSEIILHVTKKIRLLFYYIFFFSVPNSITPDKPGTKQSKRL